MHISSIVRCLSVAVLSASLVCEAGSNRPIGVFDSGTGGLTVLEKLLASDAFDNCTGEQCPDGKPDFSAENFVYFGDQANMPYGMYDAEGKADFLRELVVRDAKFMLDAKSHEPAKIIVIACNTATAYGLDAATDAAGNPRIQNAAMDIGCYEADWKGRYAADIGKHRSVIVASAAANAHEEASGEVYLPEGAISGALLAELPSKFVFPIRITGTGTLAVTVNGVTAEYQGPCGPFTLECGVAAGGATYAFAYTPGENDVGGAYFGKGGRICGTAFLIR